MFYCENPECGRVAGMRKKFQDPRRGDGEDIAYTTRYYCCDACEEAIADELERQARLARLVH